MAEFHTVTSLEVDRSLSQPGPPFAVGRKFQALPARSVSNPYRITKNPGVLYDLFRIGAAVAALILGSTVALAGDLTGQASVIDGDTLAIHGLCRRPSRLGDLTLS